MVEKPAHAFIIRIWVDSEEEIAEKPAWEGVIHHVESGRRYYFETVEEIGKHLRLYMETLNEKLTNP